MTFGAWLRRTRESKQLTQEEVADRIGRPLSWYGTFETGRKKNLPEPDELRRMAESLNVTMPDLLEAAGYLTPSDIAENRANPFERDDARWQFVEALKRLDLNDEYDAYVAVTAYTMLRTMQTGSEDFRKGVVATYRETMKQD